jgi:hypothetical protein
MILLALWTKPIRAATVISHEINPPSARVSARIWILSVPTQTMVAAVAPDPVEHHHETSLKDPHREVLQRSQKARVTALKH